MRTNVAGILYEGAKHRSTHWEDKSCATSKLYKHPVSFHEAMQNATMYDTGSDTSKTVPCVRCRRCCECHVWYPISRRTGRLSNAARPFIHGSKLPSLAMRAIQCAYCAVVRKLHYRRSVCAYEDSRMPISFHFSQRAPTPTGEPGWPLISLTSRSSYSLPKARKCAKRELKWPSERRWRICS